MTSCFSQCSADRPVIKAINAPVKSGKLIFGNPPISLSDTRNAPLISGMAARNEKLKASSLLILRKSKVEMVVPEREIPGSKAKIWVNPMIAATGKVIFLSSDLSRQNFVTVKSISPFTSSVRVMRYVEENTVSKKSLISMPARPVIKVTANIFFSLLISFKAAIISRRKNKTMEHSVPACKITSFTSILPWAMPMAFAARLRCAVELIGRNSVIPCSRPSIINFKSNKISYFVGCSPRSETRVWRELLCAPHVRN